jgi:hypothetical protein
MTIKILSLSFQPNRNPSRGRKRCLFGNEVPWLYFLQRTEGVKESILGFQSTMGAALCGARDSVLWIPVS